MKVAEATQSIKPLWESFVKNSPHSTLLQSWQWGEFKKAYGNKVIRLAALSSQFSSGDDFLQAQSKMIGAMQIIVHPLTKGTSYYYVPYGPVLDPEQEKEVLEVLLKKVKKMAKENNVAFLKLEPQVSLDKALGVEPSSDMTQAQHTLVMDITGSEKEILKGMKSKHRYNVRLAKRKEVKIKKAKTVQEIDEFWQLLQQGAQENDFSTHPKEYYQKQFEELSATGQEELLLAKKDGKTIACLLEGFYADQAYYLHGAMDRDFRKLMATHLLQWEAIKLAKKKECSKYNFWGTAPPGSGKDHPWYGFTRFKKGFCPGTKVTSYPGAYYLPYNKPAFIGYKGVKKIKKWLDL